MTNEFKKEYRRHIIANVKTLTRPRLFKLSGTQFSRDMGSCFQFIQLQTSRDYMPDALKVTLNLSIFYPEIDEQYGRTSKPTSYAEGQWRARLHQFEERTMPDWWIIRDTSRLDEAVGQIITFLPQALDYMDSISRIEDLHGFHLEHGGLSNPAKDFVETKIAKR